MILPLKRMWQGGANYFHNLLSCYHRWPDPAVKLEIFTEDSEGMARYRSDAIEIHPFPKLYWASGPRGWPRRITAKLLAYDPTGLNTMKRHNIDLLSHSSVGGQTSISTLHWEPDFQHKVLPHLFSSAERTVRDSKIANVRLWGHILLSSRAAASDFRRYYPELATVQTHILHFSSAAVLNVVPLSREELETHYPVREPYFFLPNQFWQHKNHGVVVEALLQTGPEVRVICTGLMEDRRNAAYVPSLLEKVREAGLEQRFICLHTVPYSTMVSLMHHSLAVLQPSLFEGWSTSVEESKALGKQIILSNIDVHLEQAPKRSMYFSPDSPEELARCMTWIQSEFSAPIEQAFVEQRPDSKEWCERHWVENFARIVKTCSGSPH